MAFTSLFFKKELLSLFETNMATKYMGEISGEGFNIQFGISPEGLISCWIKDLNDLPPDILSRFLSMVELPDKVGLHFHRSQRLGEFVTDDDPNE